MMEHFSTKPILIFILVFGPLLQETEADYSKPSYYNLGLDKNEWIVDSEKFEVNEKSAEFLVKSLIPFYISDLFKDNGDNATTLLSNAINQDPPLISRQCVEHLLLFGLELATVVLNPPSIINASTWAMQMIDSWGKIPEGILSGHINSLGDWDECTSVTVDIEEDNSSFKGQYCWMYFFPAGALGLEEGGPSAKKAVSVPELIESILNPKTVALLPSISTCFPSSCTEEELRILPLALLPPDPVIVPFLTNCGTRGLPPLTTGAVVMIVLLSILTLLIVVGSIVDVVITKIERLRGMREKTGIQVLLAFSLVTNIKKWQSTSSSGDGFGCIHGMRFFSTCWVVMCHTMSMIGNMPPLWNQLDLSKIYKGHWSMYFILNGYFSVDTFFAMSGLLACYSILKVLQKTDGRLNVFMLYLHRYLRLTPTYALIIGVIATIYPYFREDGGPYWPALAEAGAQNCRDRWWHNLLYINNLWPYNMTAGEFMCEGESWYIANDMQFFIVAPFFVYLLWRWERIGMIVLAAASVGSILSPAIAVGTEKLLPTNIGWKMTDGQTKIYHRPWNRIGPYLVGIWMGYFLFKIGKRPVKLHKLVVLIGWILSTCTALAILLGVMNYYDPENDDDYVAAGFYAGLSRFAWGMVICWIIFACVKGYGFWINSFLSWKPFIPLGRLTFCVYLSSLSVQMLLQSSVKQSLMFDMYQMTNMFFSHMITCFIVGFVLTMSFESPFIALEKIVFGGGSSSAPRPTEIRRTGNEGDYNENMTNTKDETVQVEIQQKNQ